MDVLARLARLDQAGLAHLTQVARGIGYRQSGFPGQVFDRMLPLVEELE